MSRIVVIVAMLCLTALALMAAQQSAGITGRWLSSNFKGTIDDCGPLQKALSHGCRPKVELTDPASGPAFAAEFKLDSSNAVSGRIRFLEHLSTASDFDFKIEDGAFSGKNLRFKIRLKVEKNVVVSAWEGDLGSDGSLTLRGELPHRPGVVKTFVLQRAK